MSKFNLALILIAAIGCNGQQISRAWQYDNEAHHGHAHHIHEGPDPVHSQPVQVVHVPENHVHSSQVISSPNVIVKSEHVDTSHRQKSETIKTQPQQVIYPHHIASFRSAPSPIHVHEHHPFDSRAPHVHDDRVAPLVVRSAPHYYRQGRLVTDHNGHLHEADHLRHTSLPGYPSSDFARYFAQYTSRGGSPQEAAHSYYRANQGHVYNYDLEPEYTKN